MTFSTAQAKRSRHGDLRWEGHLRPGPNGSYHFDKARRNSRSVYEPVMEDGHRSPVAVVKRADGWWDIELFGDVVGTVRYKSDAQAQAEELV